MDSRPPGNQTPVASGYEYQVVAVLQTGDNNLFITDSRERALMAFQALTRQMKYYKQVYIQIGAQVFDTSNLERLP